jgi:hypothetical protein
VSRTPVVRITTNSPLILRHADLLERQAQQLAQARQHPVRLVDVLVHQRRDGVQGVEEEVRLELPLQRLGLGLDQARLELRRLERPRRREQGARVGRQEFRKSGQQSDRTRVTPQP